MKFKDQPLWIVILASWGIALFEYIFQVPANRLGSAEWSVAQLKVLQECITLVVFSVVTFALFHSPIKWNIGVSYLFIVGAVYFAFKFQAMATSESPPSAQTLRALDAVNFLMADVLTGVGPFLAVYLSASLHWEADKIGVAMSAGGIAAIVAQTPAGALVDRLPYKREAIAIGAILVAASCLVTAALQSFPGTLSAQAVLGVIGTFFPPAMAGMTLGIVGTRGLDRRIGRNETSITRGMSSPPSFAV